MEFALLCYTKIASLRSRIEMEQLILIFFLSLTFIRPSDFASAQSEDPALLNVGQKVEIPIVVPYFPVLDLLGEKRKGTWLISLGSSHNGENIRFDPTRQNDLGLAITLDHNQLPLQDEPFIIDYEADLRAIEMASGLSIRGILGGSFLQKVVLCITEGGEVLTIETKNKLDQGDNGRAEENVEALESIQQQDQLTNRCRAKIAGKEVTLDVSLTNQYDFCFPREFLEQLPNGKRSSSLEVVSLRMSNGNGTTRRKSVWYFPELQVGELVVKDVLAVEGDSSSVEFGFLSRFETRIEVGEKEWISLKRSNAPMKSFGSRIPDIQIFRDEIFHTVVSVCENGRFSEYLHPGDRIISIDGKEANGLSCRTTVDRLVDAASRGLEVVIVRDGNQISVRLGDPFTSIDELKLKIFDLPRS